MKTKKCNNCNQHKNLNMFHKDRHTKDGLYTLCKECKKSFSIKFRSKKKNRLKYANNSKMWRKNNRDKTNILKANAYKRIKNFIIEFQRQNPCECGVKDIECLQYHHIIAKDEYKNTVARCTTFKSAIKELQKCIVVCANCHYKIHAGNLISDRKPPTKTELIKLLLSMYPNFILKYLN